MLNSISEYYDVDFLWLAHQYEYFLHHERPRKSQPRRWRGDTACPTERSGNSDHRRLIYHLGSGANKGAALELGTGGAWTVTVNGGLYSQDFFGLLFDATVSTPNKVTVAAGGFIHGGSGGIQFRQATNITNAGEITGGFGITDLNNTIGDVDTYTISNTGLIQGTDGAGISIVGATPNGTHTITNKGTISGTTNSIFATASDNSIEKVTNSGTLIGDLDLGGGNDTLTNSGVIKNNVSLGAGNDTLANTGTIIGIIDLGAGNDTFTGGAPSETVFDNAGSDKYTFGAGDDVYKAVNANEALGDVDTVDGGVGLLDVYDASNATLSVSVNLDAIAHIDDLGGSSNVAKTSATGSDVGTDTVKNVEWIKLGDANDIAFGSTLANTLDGGKGADNLYGLAGNDVLLGGDGADKLDGGLGKDIMTGGADSDSFIFRSIKDSGILATTRDVITDFTQGADKLDLSRMDAGATLTLHFAGNLADPGFAQAFDGTKGMIQYTFTGTQTVISIDTTGDKKADFSLALDGHINLTGTDFIL